GVLLVEAVDETIFVAARLLTVQLQAQHVVLNRSAQEEIGLVDISGAAISLLGRIETHRPSPFLGHLAGNDVDHTAHGIRPVQRGHRTAYHFDTLDGFERRQPALLDAGAVAVRTRFARVLTPTVDQ